MKTTERFDRALPFAASLHRDQMRKQGDAPYISHLLAVSALVMEYGGNEDEAIAALLHDSVEDQGDGYPGGRDALRASIRTQFGARVLEIVDACTDDNDYAKGQAPTPEMERAAWLRRKEAYLEHLRRTSDEGIRRVACADKLHNACSMLAVYRKLGEQLWPRFRTGRAEDQAWYMAQLAAIFTGDSPLEERFRAAAAQVARIAAPR